MRARRQRRQIGARHIARMRGAFRGDTARPANTVVKPADQEPDGATQARPGAKQWRPVRELAGFANARPDFRDLTCEAAAAGRMAAEFA